VKLKVNMVSGPKPPAVHLSGSERQDLEQLVTRHRTEQQIALRARIVLGAAAGKGNAQIGRELQVTVDTARLWRQRWLDLQAIPASELNAEERLQDLPRPGAPARITADQRCQIEALACEKPEASERPISQWTSREIADEILKRGIVAEISPRHAARLLKRRRSQAAPDPLLVDA
jgi:transposase